MRWVSRCLVYIVGLLLFIGVVMLASTSSVRGSATFNDPEYFLKRQLIWLCLAVVAMVVISRCDYHWWRNRSVALLLGVVTVAAIR